MASSSISSSSKGKGKGKCSSFRLLLLFSLAVLILSILYSYFSSTLSISSFYEEDSDIDNDIHPNTLLDDIPIPSLPRSLLPIGTTEIPCSHPPSLYSPSHCLFTSPCSRILLDDYISPSTASSLRLLLHSSLSLVSSHTPSHIHSSPNGPVTIFDISSGAVSGGDSFIGLYKLLDYHHVALPLHSLLAYKNLTTHIKHHITTHFGIHQSTLRLASPSFISRIRGNPAAREGKLNDIYWETHVDVQQYGDFAFTVLVYLNENDEYEGGNFVYINNPKDKSNNNKSESVVIPQLGRVSIFTSGHENPHYVEKVTKGERWALTIAFTCGEHSESGKGKGKKGGENVEERLEIEIERAMEYKKTQRETEVETQRETETEKKETKEMKESATTEEN